MRPPRYRQPYVGRIRGFSRAMNCPTKRIILFLFFIKYCKAMICLECLQISPHHCSFFTVCRTPYISIFGRVFDSFSCSFSIFSLSNPRFFDFRNSFSTSFSLFFSNQFSNPRDILSAVIVEMSARHQIRMFDFYGFAQRKGLVVRWGI